MTVKLVENTASQLNEEQTRHLFDLIKAWEKSDKVFFEEMLESQRQLKGDQWPGSRNRSTENRVTVNLAYAMFKTSLPFIFFKNPTARTRPRNPLHVGKEVVWDGIYNGVMPLIDYAKQKRMQVEDAWVYGEGWSKWVVSPQEGGNARGTSLTEVPRGPAKWQGKGLPVSLRLTPRQVVVDSEARGRDPDEARAIAVKYRRPLSEVLADKRYKIIASKYPKKRDAASGRRSDASSTEFSESIRARLDDFFDVDRATIPGSQGGEEIVTIWEIWVYQLVDFKLFRQVVTLMEDYPLPIMHPEPWERFVGDDFPGWPVRRMVFNAVPDSTPTNTIKLTKNLQRTFNWVVSRLVNHVDTLNTVRTINSAGVKDMKKTMRQLRRGRSLEYLEVKEPNAIENVATPPFSGDSYNLLSIVEGLIDRTGSGSKNRAGDLGARTATEANIVEQSQATEDSDTVDIVRSFLVEDLEQLGMMLKNMLAPDQLLKIAGDTGGVDFTNVDDDVLSDIPEVFIEVDSFRKVSIQEKLQPWQVIWNFAMQAFPVMPDLRLDVILGRISHVLDIDPGTFMGNLEDERVSELFDIINSIQAAEEGQDPLEVVPIRPDANPIISLQMLEFFLQSETAQRMGQGAIAALQPRRLELMKMRQEVQASLGASSSQGQQANLGQNPEPTNGSQAADPATRARSATQQGLQAGGLQPGTRGIPT